MARIKGKDLYLKDDDQIYFGDDKDVALWYIGNDLFLNHTISGVDPVLPGHLVTKRYLEDNTVNEFSELIDTPVTYSGSASKFLRVNTGETGVEYAPISDGDFVVHGNLQFVSNPTYNGEIHLLGWYTQTDSSVSLSSGSPITASNKGFHSHFVMDVSNLTGAPFTIDVSGVTVNEATGVYSSDSESVTISGVGYYQTAKSFIDEPTFSIVESSKSCTLDIYKSTYWDHANERFTVTGCRLEWEPDQNNWDIDLKIYHHLNDGSLSLIDNIVFDNSDTYPRAAASEPGKYKRTDYNTLVKGDEHEGIILSVNQNSIGNIYLELRYDCGGGQ